MLQSADNVTYFITMPSYTHKEVVRFNISVDEVFIVDILYSIDHLKNTKNYFQ